MNASPFQGYSGAGSYRLDTGSGAEVFYCTESDVEDCYGHWILIFQREADASTGARPLINMSQHWFNDLVIGRVEAEASHAR
ncbi:hypothetical protein [Bosea sp. PAMC 26642]|uniref:hypothetical protein n=1 Tax=Bosea sp. (strain PAMC 26642) TaxID=1792307 RepID=UPI0007706B46|nr:hypothetical protein [Bosea sp. PAMC 26642]AMJ60929.1 hypothetical protein AXW83_12060 [Bosea sp. PAMC 26642]